MKSLFVPVSQNAKTGPISATITERASCWSGCGCYALYGVLKATAARDVRPGESWAFLDHRTMAKVIVDEKAANSLTPSARQSER